jgi:two-component system, NtrC family, sensor histidine kinase HydH
VQVAVGNAVRDGQLSDVRGIIEAVKLRDPSIDVIVFDASGAMTASSWGSRGTDPLVRGAVAESRTANAAIVRFEGPRGLASLLGVFPIFDGSQNVGTLAVVRPLDELRRDLGAETRSTILALATLIVGLAAAGWFLASWYVRGPVLELVGAMRAVRSGDLSAKAAFRRADEMGAAAAEFNAMMGELADARQRLIAEGEARELLEARLQRADKLVTVGQLSAGLAHEIGSPLQVLNGRARAIAARSDLPADVRRSADVLANESDRITRIVEQLVTFSRQTIPSIAGADIAAPVRDIVELLEPDARRHDVRLEFHCDAALPAANVDVGQVQQVTMNLLRNAVAAAPPKGRVRLSLESGSFSRAGGPPQPSVSMIVEDTGEGIPDAFLPRIFEPFFTTRSHNGGTGLGLAVVKTIVDAHGGAITVTSRVGAGTRFTVHFPVAGAAVAGGWVA